MQDARINARTSGTSAAWCSGRNAHVSVDNSAFTNDSALLRACAVCVCAWHSPPFRTMTSCLDIMGFLRVAILERRQFSQMAMMPSPPTSSLRGSLPILEAPPARASLYGSRPLPVRVRVDLLKRRQLLLNRIVRRYGLKMPHTKRILSRKVCLVHTATGLCKDINSSLGHCPVTATGKAAIRDQYRLESDNDTGRSCEQQT